MMCGHISRTTHIEWVCTRAEHTDQPKQHFMIPNYQLTDFERMMTGYESEGISE